jgi:uncharacterized protein (TIGR03083 family)
MAQPNDERTPEQIAASLGRCYDEIVGIVTGLTDDQWAVQSLCPDWDVQGVVGHLLAVENMLVDWRPTSVDDPLPFDRIGPYLAATTDWSNARWAEEATTLLQTRTEELAALPPQQWSTPCPTPVGPGTYGRFMDIRTFDFWVHGRDIATPLGLDLDHGGPAAEVAINEIDRSMGYIVGKKVGLPDGMGITFEVTGPVQRNIHVLVDGRAARVDSLDDPSVVVTADTVTFAQLACGRIDPQEAIDAGRVSWTGDAEWGERAARSLAFTM